MCDLGSASPISSFNAFVSYVERKQTEVSLKGIVWLFVRLFLTYIAFETVLHYVYYYSISSHDGTPTPKLSLLPICSLTNV